MPLQEVHTGFTFNFDGSKMAAIQRGVKRASTGLNSVAAKTEMFTQRMGGFIARAGQVIGAYAGFRLLKSLTTDYAAAADQIAKFSAGLGISAQEYQRLTFAAELNGVTVAELNVALPKFAKSAADAADGSKAMADAFDRAGLKLKGSRFLGDPIDMLKAFADGLKDIKDPIRRAQVLQNSFGRAGKKMGVLMAQGSEGIQKAMKEADKYGIVLSDKALKAGEKFTDEMLRFRSVLTGVRNTIASQLLPSLSRALQTFRTWWTEGRNAERALRALKLAAFFTGIVIAQLFGASVIRQVKMFVTGIWAGVQALRAMGMAGAIAAIKIWAIIIAFALVALAIEDLIGFAQGKDSVIGRLLGDTKRAKELKKALLDVWDKLKKAWEEMKPSLKRLKKSLGDLLDAAKPHLWELFIGTIDGITWSLEALADAITITTEVISGVSQWWDDANAAANRYTIAAEEAAGVDVAKSWDDANAAVNRWLLSAEKAVKDLGNAITSDLNSAVKELKAAWNSVANAASDAYNWIKASLNLQGLGGALSGIDEFGKVVLPATPAAPRGSVASDGTAIMPGLMQPWGGLKGGPIQSFAAGPGFQPPPQAVTTTVAPGAVNVTVNAANADAKQVALIVKDRVDKSLATVITGASRDLVKPPRGQS